MLFRDVQKLTSAVYVHIIHTRLSLYISHFCGLRKEVLAAEAKALSNFSLCPGGWHTAGNFHNLDALIGFPVSVRLRLGVSVFSDASRFAVTLYEALESTDYVISFCAGARML